MYDHLKHAKQYGIEGVGEVTLNWQTILERKNQIITKHVKGLDFLMRKNKVTVIAGTGSLTSAAKGGVHTVTVKGADGKAQQVQAKAVLVATGSDARMLPNLTPDDRILTNIEILKMDRIPKSLIVIGAGAVGVEFGSIFKSFWRGDHDGGVPAAFGAERG